MPTFRYAGYPTAHVFDADRKTKRKHLLWGDWVRVEDDDPDPQAGWVPVRVRGVSGWMREGDLQDERLLEMVFVDVGQGDGALVVTPQDKHLVVDAGISDHMLRFLRWRYAGFKQKWTFEAGILTHPDEDHYRGFKPLLEEPNVHFRALYHNGIMEERGDAPLGRTRTEGAARYLTDLVETRDDLDGFLTDEDRWKHPGGNPAWDKRYPTVLHAGHTSGRVAEIAMLSTRHGEIHGGRSYLPGFGPQRALSIEVLGPVPEPAADGTMRLRWFRGRPDGGSFDKGKTKNGHSVLLKLTYRDLSVLFGGDLNTSAQAYLLEHYAGLPALPHSAAEEETLVAAARPTFECDVVKSCHHGSSDVLDAFLRATNPAAVVVSSGDEEGHAHPRADALGALGRFGRGSRPVLLSTELARSTREHRPDHLSARLGTLRTLRAQAGNRAQDPTLSDDERRRAREDRDRADALLDEVTDAFNKRNVTVYGSINLRSDGRRALLAYRLERPTKSRQWDVYRLERAGNGPLTLARSGGH